MSRFISDRSTLSTVLSVIALFVALGGSAYAAARITGATVKDNSLSGKDIRDRSVRAKDLRAGVLKPGPVGPSGPAGPRGPQGKPGTAAAVQRVGPRTALSGLNQTIFTAPVPAGSWVITATALLNNNSGGTASRGAECSIRSGTALIAETGLMSVDTDQNAAKADTEQFSITGVIAHNAPRQVALVCDRAGASELFIERPALTAIQVGSINTENGD